MLSAAAAKLVKQAIRNPYAWPGGYEIYAVTDDGGVLCGECLKKNYEAVISAYPGDGWAVAAVGHTGDTDGPLSCDHCNKQILECWQCDGKGLSPECSNCQLVLDDGRDYRREDEQ